MKNNPLRTCVYTRVKKSKYELLRLVKKNDIYVLDINMTMEGRGIYIYPCEKSLVLIDKNKKYYISEINKKAIKDEIIKIIKVGESNGK